MIEPFFFGYGHDDNLQFEMTMMNKNRKGEILRIKQGYNPNSSSMGSIVFALPAALFGVTALFGAVSGIIISGFMRKPKKPDTKEQSASAETEKDEVSTNGEGG